MRVAVTTLRTMTTQAMTMPGMMTIPETTTREMMTREMMTRGMTMIDVDDDFDNARIGPEGGNLQLSDFLLEVPEGALDEPTMLSVQRESTPIVDENADPLSDSFRLSPPGLLFNVPIRVTVTLDSTPPNETIAPLVLALGQRGVHAPFPRDLRS